MKVTFLDRDGTLIYEPPDGLVQPEDFQILPGVIDTLRELQSHGHCLVMITNQDFSKGDRESFDTTQEMLLREFDKAGITFDKLFVCPHSPEDNCSCRKPKTGMVDTFLQENTVDLSVSVVVGDRESADGGLAQNIGVRYYKMESNGKFPTLKQLMDTNS